MSELNQKFQRLTGINGFDVDKYIESTEDKQKAYNEIQWKIAKGLVREQKLLRGADSETIKLYAEVMSNIAEACNVDVDNIDINSNGTIDPEDTKAKEALSEAYAILSGDIDGE